MTAPGKGPTLTAKQIALYELSTGKRWPAEPTTADMARARTWLVMYNEDKKRLAQQKRIATRARNINDSFTNAPVRPQRVVLSEDKEHGILVEWLEYRLDHYDWWHYPIGEKRSRRTAARLKRMGAKAGVPDFQILAPLPRPPGGVQPRGVAIELKRSDGGKGPSDEQTKWLNRLAHNGWLVRVCNGAAEAIAWLEEMGL